MSFPATERPGVYSTYSVRPFYPSSPLARAAVVAACQGEAKAAIPVGSWEEFTAAFGEGQGELAAVVSLLLAAGVPKIHVTGLGEEPQLADYEAAFSALNQGNDFYALVCGSEDTEVLAKLKSWLELSAAAQREHVAFAGITEMEAALAAAKALNSERMVLCCGRGEFQGQRSALFGAAALAGLVLASEDVSASFCYAPLEGLEGLEAPFSEEDIDRLLLGGVTVLEENGGTVEVIKAVTTRTQAGGQPDRSFCALNTVLIIDEVMASVRAALRQKLKGAKNNAVTRESIASQVVVILSGLVDEGKLESYQTPVCRQSEDDPSVCLVQIAFRVAYVIHQIVIDARIAL